MKKKCQERKSPTASPALSKAISARPPQFPGSRTRRPRAHSVGTISRAPSPNVSPLPADIGRPIELSKQERADIAAAMCRKLLAEERADIAAAMFCHSSTRRKLLAELIRQSKQLNQWIIALKRMDKWLTY